MEPMALKAEPVPTPTSAAPTERGGFSLLEVLMALAILGVLGLLLARLGQGSLHISQVQDDDFKSLPERQNHIAEQFAGERPEPLLQLLPTPSP